MFAAAATAARRVVVAVVVEAVAGCLLLQLNAANGFLPSSLAATPTKCFLL